MKELLPKVMWSVSDAVRIWLQVCLTLVFTFSRNSSLTCSCELKFEDFMYNMVTTVGNCTTELEFVVRVELKCFHTQKEDKYVRWCINEPDGRNPFTVCMYMKSWCKLEIPYDFVSYTSIKLKKKTKTKLSRPKKKVQVSVWENEEGKVELGILNFHCRQ